MPTLDGTTGSIHYERWSPPQPPDRIVVIVHGYAEYAARYAHLADRLTSAGAVVYAQDHMGHGHSDGERALTPTSRTSSPTCAPSWTSPSPNIPAGRSS